MTVTAAAKSNLFLDIIEWGQNIVFNAQNAGKKSKKLSFQITSLKKHTDYTIEIDNKKSLLSG